jgi:hypothetical protein
MSDILLEMPKTIWAGAALKFGIIEEELIIFPKA